MLIGQDFEKITFQFLEYELLEPNSFIGDIVVSAFGFYFALICSRYYKQTRLIFFKHWKHFFYLFGIGFVAGGFGHLLYNYWGIPGKIPAWYISGITSTMFLELAIASLLPKERYQRLVRFFLIKTSVIWLIEAFIIAFINLKQEPTLGMIGPTLAMITALPTSLGVLGYRFSKTITPTFKYLWMSLIVFSPSLLFQAMKINFHQLFDRNDVSHVLLCINVTLYFLAIKGYYKFQTESNKGKKSIEARGSLS